MDISQEFKKYNIDKIYQYCSKWVNNREYEYEYRMRIYQMNPGKIRRCHILKYLTLYESLPINREYCLILKHDVDLRYLLKGNLIKTIREPSHSWAKRSNYTYIKLMEKC